MFEINEKLSELYHILNNPVIKEVSSWKKKLLEKIKNNIKQDIANNNSSSIKSFRMSNVLPRVQDLKFDIKNKNIVGNELNWNKYKQLIIIEINNIHNNLDNFSNTDFNNLVSPFFEELEKFYGRLFSLSENETILSALEFIEIIDNLEDAYNPLIKDLTQYIHPSEENNEFFISLPIEATIDNVTDFLEDISMFEKIYSTELGYKVIISVNKIGKGCLDVSLDLSIPDNPESIREIKDLLTHDLKDQKDQGKFKNIEKQIELTERVNKALQAGSLSSEDAEYYKNKIKNEDRWYHKLTKPLIQIGKKIFKTEEQRQISPSNEAEDLKLLTSSKEEILEHLKELERKDASRGTIIKEYRAAIGSFSDNIEIKLNYVKFLINKTDANKYAVLEELIPEVLAKYPNEEEIKKYYEDNFQTENHE